LTSLLLAASGGLALAQQPGRTVVPLTAEEREHVLGEMRDFLGFIEKATAALAQSDFQALAAARSGPGEERMPPSIAQKLPMAFRKLALSTHQQIDAIAADAGKRDLSHSLEQSARLLQTCNACHAAFEFPKKEHHETCKRLQAARRGSSGEDDERIGHIAHTGCDTDRHGHKDRRDFTGAAGRGAKAHQAERSGHGDAGADIAVDH
jgi:hypothetical protein